MTREIPIVSPLLGALDELDERLNILASLLPPDDAEAEFARRQRFDAQMAELARIREEGFAHLRESK